MAYTHISPTPRTAAPRPLPQGTAGMVSPQRQKSLKALSTSLFLACAGVAGVVASMAPDAETAFKAPGYYVAAGIALMLWAEALAGLRNLIRADIFMILVLFLLTFFEFIILPDSEDGVRFILLEDRINKLVSVEAARTAVHATLLGFAGIVLGRHAFAPRTWLPRKVNLRPSPKITIGLLCFCSFLGYLYMLRAVNFDIVEMLYQMQRPRFSQPWSRGRLGGLSTLLNEFGLLKYLIPPLCGAILAQRRYYGILGLAFAAAMLALVFFEGFAGGTRNIFLTHLITFLTTYVLLMPRLTLIRLALTAGPILALAYFAVYFLPAIRTVGLMNFDLDARNTGTLFVDLNLFNIARLIEVFPLYYDHIGFEVPYIALIRPIPRALWPGKPEGLSTGIEEALGVQGLTLSATFVGEMWMAGGFLAILLAGLGYGAAAAWWTRRNAAQTGTLSMIVFAIGLFPAGIGMRSFMSLAPTILPVVFIILAVRMFRLKT